MSLSVFFELVEIKTKLASVFPFLVGTLFSLYYFNAFNPLNTLIFFAAMFSFDMATTAINNFMDYKKAKDNHYQDNVNVVGREHLSEKRVESLIVGLITLSSLLGIWLVLQTNLLLLFMGGACFFIGIFYTFGPVPLSRMPLGELFSGATMGFGIFFISVYINAYQQNILTLDFSGTNFLLIGDWLTIIGIALVSAPTVFTIANIMLANNLCDLDEDIKNHRYTLPFYIGRKYGILLFDVLMYGSYVTLIIAVATHLLSPIMLLVLLTFPIIHKNVKLFNAKQIKSETFDIAIKNLALFNGAQIIGLILSLLVKAV